MPRSQTLSGIRARLVYGALACGLALTGASSSAHAACASAIAKDAASSTISMTKSVASAGLMITQAFIEMNDSLTRYANQLSNNVQNAVKTQQSLSDNLSAQVNSSAMGVSRASAAAEFMPSRVVCNIVSGHERLNTTQASYAAYRTTLQNKNTSYSNNATGSGSERGTLQAMNTVFKDRCSKYANPTTMQPPGSVPCPGPSDTTLRDLDIQPWKAILDPVSFNSAVRQQAAVDAVRMLTEVAPPDPVRGNILLRQEGQNLHVMRMRDVTRMNLARGVLEDIVAIRTADPGTPGSKSRLASYIELINGRTYDPATNSLSGELLAVMSAQEPENAAAQTISARLATQQALIFELMRLGEQITALEATELAIKIERSRGAGASVASRPVNN